MFKFLLFSIVFLFLYSCASNNAVKKQEVCAKDKTIVCSKANAPILEKMDDKEISAQINIFKAGYRNTNAVKYMKTDVSELDQCISVYQYYNCKAYCESDKITKEDKVKKDQEIVKECTKMMNKNRSDIKELNKILSNKEMKNRIYIDFIAEDGANIDNKLKKIVYLAFEEKATQTTGKYVIIDDEEKKKAEKKIKEQYNITQNDPKYLPKLQKQLAANIMVEIKATPMGNKLLLTNKFVLLEEAAILKTKNLIYSPDETEENTKNEMDDFDDPFEKKEVNKKLREEKIYEAYSKLAEEFFKSLDN